MKQIPFKTRILLSLVLVFFLAGCSLFDKDDVLTAEEAKMEIRASGQEITANLEDMMATPAMKAMEYFYELLSDGDDWKSAAKSAARETITYNLKSLNILIREDLRFNVEKDDDDYYGIYRFNFNTGGFDLVNANVDYLHFIFPSSEAAHISQVHNASLKIDNMRFTTITITDDWETYDEELLTRAKAELVVDNQTLLFFDYESSFNEHGLPVSLEATLSMAPYQFRISQSGSGQNYSSTMSLRKGNETLMSYSLSVRYNETRSEVARVSGHFQLTPLRFEGSINSMGMEDCDYDDVACMNQHLDVSVKHTRLNKKIGHLEYRSFYDTSWDDYDLELYVVYDDGSAEPLADVFDLQTGDLKHGFRRSARR